MPEIKLTDEQIQGVDMAKKMSSFKMSALAGTGKTTTLAEIARGLKKKRGLYLSFNKGIAVEAQKRFSGTNCTARTFHSLAFAGFGKKYGSRLNQRLNAGFIRERFCVGGDHAYLVSGMALDSLGKFLRTIDDEVGPEHSVWPDACKTIFAWKPDVTKSEVDQRQSRIESDMQRKVCFQIQSEALPLAQKIYNEMRRPTSDFPVTHDLYLREFVASMPDLSSSRFGYEYILFDEAQDADHLMLMLTTAQSLPVFYVGDAHQQIYSWRGAENAMSSLDLPETPLTTSFRFGRAVADDANEVLTALGSKFLLNVLPSKSSRVECNANIPQGTRAVISRTNGQVVSATLNGLKDGVRVGVSGLRGIKSFLRDYRSTEAGRPSGQFALFNSVDDLREHAQTESGSDLKTWLDLVGQYGADVLESAMGGAQDLDKDKEVWKSCERVAITAHASKGMEFDSVHLSDDLFNPKRLKGDEEKRLLYVAKTRAMSVLSQGKSFVEVTQGED